MNFSEALKGIKGGRKFARDGWNGRGMHVAIQLPDENSTNKQPYIYIQPANDGRVPWVASQTDLLADDWMEVA